MRIQVPFGRRSLVGIITGTSEQTDFPPDKIRPAEKLIDTQAIIDSQLLALYQWSADYYQFPLGLALQTSVPAQIRKGEPAEIKPRTGWQLSTLGLETSPESLDRAPRQQQVLAALSGGPLTLSDLNEKLDTSTGSILRTLEEKELVEEVVLTPVKAPDSDNLYGEDQPLTLNTEQARALSAIQEKSGEFGPFLLEGITGSGKTEVYLQAIAEILEQGKQVLVMVPEISLTPQTVRRFARRFQRQIAVFHSGLTDTQRFTAWLDARSGKADIIIGTRSAIFTPMANPGLIIVDEEHDPSYKQQDGFRYSGRDLAIYRARQLDIPVILGTATPSLESLNNALAGRYGYLQLTERAGEATHPHYHLLDLKDQTLNEGFSEALLDMIGSHLKQGNQVLIFLNRRGFAPILLCRHCGWIASCARCDTSYTLHRTPPSLSCHHCESRIPVTRQCPVCSGSDLAPMGMGTEKTEELLKQFYPNTPVYRIDRDSTRNRDNLHALLDNVDSGEPCILVGTQMLSKGHHFPGVTLVAVLDADGGLFSDNFRGQEHMGQLLTQVAGRAGRGSLVGEVIIQTYNSTHPTLQALVQDGYNTFARRLLEERKQGRLPPFAYMALIRAEANNRALPERFLNAIRTAASQYTAGASVIGPMPAPMEKRSGMFRFQLLLDARHRPALQQVLATLMPILESHGDSRKLRWSVDVDPVDFT